MEQSLAGRVALVTGAAHRVGKGIALELARQGMHIAVHYYGSAEKAAQTAQEIRALGVEALPIQADQGDAAQVAALVEAVRARFHRLDLLVNSANMYTKADFLAITPEAWQRVLDVNLTGPFLLSQAAARQMLAQDPPGGVIVNIIDNSALTPWPTHPHHSVAKAGLWSLTQIMTRRLAPHIRVSAVSPGPVLKEDGRSDESWARTAARLPLERAGSPEDVGRAVAFLAREDFLTGALIHVDGGEWLNHTGSDGKPE